MTDRRRFIHLAVGLAAALGGTGVHAQATGQPFKIGFILPMTGQSASTGKQIEAAIKHYVAQNGNTVAGRKVEVIVKDDAGVADTTRRIAQELVGNEKVGVLAGFGLTPLALATAPIATQSKTPMVVTAAATSIITEQSPYIVRTSFTLPQVAVSIAEWAAKNKIKHVYTLVSDYGPGNDAEGAFKKTFTAAGGTVQESIRTPLQNPDFGPFIQRVKDAKPDAVFIFVPAGAQSIAVMKAYNERGLAAAGIKAIATGDVTDDHVLNAMGDDAVGLITTFHYSAAHDSPENKAFLAAYAQVAPNGGRANFMTVGAYDGMALIYDIVAKSGGKIDADKAMEVAKGWKTTSPRGPIMIDPETRDIVQTIYLRKVEKKDGQLWNVEFDVIKSVKDPGKNKQ